MYQYLLSGILLFAVAAGSLGEEATRAEAVLRSDYIDQPDLKAEAKGFIRCQALPFISYRRNGRSSNVKYLSKEQLRTDPRIIVGNVTKIQDGDTFEIKDVFDQPLTIHLHSVNAPELDQHFGDEAAAQLRELLPIGTRVFAKKDRYARTSVWGALPRTHREFMSARNEWLCTVDVDNGELGNPYRTIIGDIGLRMVASGHAWYPGIINGKPLPEHAIAKEQKIGLWAQEKPQNPVLWFQEDLERKRKASWPHLRRNVAFGGMGGGLGGWRGHIRDIQGAISYIEFLRIYNVEPFIELTYEQAEQLSEVRNPEADATKADFERSNRQVFEILEPKQETEIRRLAHHTFFANSWYEMAAAQMPNSLSPEHVAKLKQLTRQHTNARTRLVQSAGKRAGTRKARYQQNQLGERFKQAVKNALPERYFETVGPWEIVRPDYSGLGSMFSPSQPYPRVF